MSGADDALQFQEDAAAQEDSFGQTEDPDGPTRPPYTQYHARKHKFPRPVERAQESAVTRPRYVSPERADAVHKLPLTRLTAATRARDRQLIAGMR